MAAAKTLAVSATREGAMPEVIVPGPMIGLLAAFEPCFHAPSTRIGQLVVAGWVHCLGRRTVTGVALASGGLRGQPGAAMRWGGWYSGGRWPGSRPRSHCSS
jgi:hypothetical protein